MMRIIFVIYLLMFNGCDYSTKELVQTGEVSFRISLNYGRELSLAEADSLEKTKPVNFGIDTASRFYQALQQRGVVVDRELDTSLLRLKRVTWEKPKADFGNTSLILDTTGGNDHIVLRHGDTELKTLLGPRLLGDIFVSYSDNNSDFELIVLKKYYIINGYNFDLTAYSPR